MCGFLVLGIAEFELRFIGVIEQGEELIVLAMQDWVALVGVALRAPEGQTEPGGACCGDAVGHGVKSKLERIDASFLVEHGIAVKSCGDQLIAGG